MSKKKAVEYIRRAEDQLSGDIITVRFVEMALHNLNKALKELEDKR